MRMWALSSSDPSVNITEDGASIAIDFSRDSNYIVNYLKSLSGAESRTGEA